MIVLITGGASGLGEAITRKMAQSPDCQVYFTYTKAFDNATQIESEYPNATGIKCDFTDGADLKRLCDTIAQIDIDVLVNNAYTGGFIETYFHKTPGENFSKAFQDNVIPTVIITQTALGIFRKKKYGKIITILTAALMNTPPIGSAVYTATKAYLEQLMKVWATENAKFNVTSNAISPAFMSTGFTESVDDRVVEQIIDKHPLRKLLTVEEVADAVHFMTNTTQQINGINLTINAGSDLS